MGEFDTTRRGFFGLFGAGVGLQSSGLVALEFPHHPRRGVNRTIQPTSFDLSYPTDVIDSFIDLTATAPYLLGRSGWSEVPLEQQLQAVRRLHPDRLDTHANIGGFYRPPTAMAGGPASAQGHFAEEAAIPVGGQQHLQPNVEGWTTWYRHRPDSERWTTDDGTVIDGVLDFAAERFDGEPRIDEDFGVAVASVFFDRFRRYMTEAATGFLSHGFAHVYLDNATAPTRIGLDYSDRAETAFRRHLESLSSTRLEELGIEDPSTFHIRDHLRERGLTPGEAETPYGDPVAREYKRHHLLAHRNYLKRYRDGIHDAFPNRSDVDGICVVGNTGMDIPFPSSIVIADSFDAVHGESEHTVPDTKILDWKYKLATAAGRFTRPVVSIGSMITKGGFSTSTAEGLDPETEYSTLQNLQVAEAFASGGHRSLSLAGWGMNDDWAVDNWIRPDGTVPDELQSFLDFCWANRPYLESTESANDVALVYSLPTVVWQYAPEWGNHRPAHMRAFQGAAALLRRHQLPYDVLVFGLPEVWEDAEQLARLGDYRTVVLPAVDAVSDPQVDTVRDALAGGTHVVATGGAASRDADRQPGDDFEPLLEEHGNATVVQETPGVAVHDGDQPSTDLEGPLTANGRQVTVDASDVVVTVRTQAEAGRTILHFVNYDWDRDTDTVPSHTDVTASFDSPAMDVQEAVWVTPSGRHEIDLTKTGDRIEVTLPSLRLWGLLVLANEASALYRGDEAAAANAIKDARNAIQSAVDSGRDHLGLQIARTEVANAEAGRNHGAYEMAVRTAEKAQTAATDAVEPPAIGIDQAHSQAGSTGWAAFEKLRTRFDWYEYRRVTEWAPDILASLDMLIVPPPADGRYEFTPVERDRLEVFVRAGGRVIVLGRPDVPSDHSELTERYGFSFDGDPVIQRKQSFGQFGQARVDPREIDARGVPSTLTQYAISFRTRNVTPVSVIQDAVATLGYVHEEGRAYVNRSDSAEEQNDPDDDASGLPLIVARSVGDGYVAGIGTVEHFQDPTQGEDGGRKGPQNDVLVTSLLRTATRGDMEPGALEKSLQETESSESSPTAGSTQDGTGTYTAVQDTTVGSGENGFGIAAALGGIAGIAALIQWLDDDE